MSKPYYECDGVTIFHGDCRELLLEMEPVDVIVTDPVWPNSSPALRGADRPAALFAEAAQHFPGRCQRVIVQLGCDSDPRFLLGVPASLPFFRVCWLEYVCPTRKGRLLYTGDVAYVFGIPPKSAPGRRVMSGRYISTRPDASRVKLTAHKDWGCAANNGMHPTPRRYEHVAWIVGRWSDGTVLDPFAGSGTTLLASKRAGRRAIGIEIEERFCEQAARRLDQYQLEMGA